jgi:hypothetical protein
VVAIVLALIEIFTSHSVSNVRAQAAVCHGWIGPSSSNAVNALIVGSSSADSGIENNSIWALGKIGGDPDLLIPIYTNKLFVGNSTLMNNATIGLKNLGTNARVAIPLLMNLATNPQSEKRFMFISTWSALKEIEPNLARRLEEEYGEQYNIRPSKKEAGPSAGFLHANLLAFAC